MTARDPACELERRLAELGAIRLALRDALRGMLCRMLLERVATLRGRGR